MEIKSLFFVFVAVIEVLIGFYIFIRGSRDASNKSFASFAVFTGFWVFVNSLAYTEFWVKTLYCVGLFLIVTGLLWVSNFSERKLKKNIYYSLYAVSSIFGFVIYFTDLIIYYNNDLFKNTDGLEWTFGPLYSIYSIFLLGVVFCILFFIHIGLHKAKGIKKEQLKFVFTGAYLFALSVVFIDFILPVFGITSLIKNNYDALTSLFFVIFSAYAILKHHLFDIKVVAVETLAILISLIVLIKFVTSDGSTRVLNGLLFVGTVVFGSLLVRGTLKDIEAREHIEQLGKDLVVANEQLRQIDKQKSDFVSIASHQLRTPLTAIKGYASLILEGSFGEIPEGVRGAMTKIFEPSQRMVMIIENFLTVSRIERDNMCYRFETLDLQDIVKKMVEETRPMAYAQGLEVRFSEREGYKYLVQADNIKMKQVVHNLISDAIGHTQKGFVEVSLSTSQYGEDIILAISDTGSGATAKQLRQKFEKETTIKEGQKETGIELFIVREIVKAHQGKVWAESEGAGKGLTFFVELPAVKNVSV